MSTPVRPVTTAFELASVQTAKQVSSAHSMRLADACSFLGCHNLRDVMCSNYWTRNPARTQLNALTSWHTPFIYRRSPGAMVLAVVVVLYPGSGSGNTCTVTVSKPSGAAWLHSGGLDGLTNHNYPPSDRVTQPELVGFMDVSACSISTIHTLTATVTFTGSAVCEGFARVQVVEIPLPTSDVTGDPAEPALEQAWCVYPNTLIDGSKAVARGFTRLGWLLDTYRDAAPTVQLCGVASSNNAAIATNPHWYREGAGYGALEWQYQVTGDYDPKHRFRVRQLYGQGGGTATQTWKLYVYYKTSAAVAGGLKIYLDAVSGTAQPAQTVALAATSNVWTWTSATITMPADGTGGEVDGYFTADSGGVGEVLQVAGLCLIDCEA